MEGEESNAFIDNDNWIWFGGVNKTTTGKIQHLSPGLNPTPLQSQNNPLIESFFANIHIQLNKQHESYVIFDSLISSLEKTATKIDHILDYLENNAVKSPTRQQLIMVMMVQ